MKKLLMCVTLICSACMVSNAQNTSGKCYRGFVDAGYVVGFGDYESGRFVVNTIHGSQFITSIFLSAGSGLLVVSKYETKNIYVTVDIREAQV